MSQGQGTSSAIRAPQTSCGVESLFDLVAVEDDERRVSQSSKAGAVAKQGIFRGGLSDVKQTQINVKGDTGSCTGGAVK